MLPQACKFGCALAQAVINQPVTTETQVQSQASPCVMCGGQCGTGTGFSQVSLVWLVSAIPLVLHFVVKAQDTAGTMCSSCIVLLL